MRQREKESVEEEVEEDAKERSRGRVAFEEETAGSLIYK